MAVPSEEAEGAEEGCAALHALTERHADKVLVLFLHLPHTHLRVHTCVLTVST